MHPSKLHKGELIAALGGVALVIGVFLPAYTPSSNPHAIVAGIKHPGHATIWQANHIHRIFLIAAAIAPVVLLYIVLRNNQTSWPRGEMTAVIGLIAVTLLGWDGIIQRPGDPSGQISLDIGWLLAFLGAIAIAVGGSVRATESERPRKPPGVL